MQQAVQELNAAAKAFVETSSSVTLSKPVYENGWNAKMIIGHIVFYHDYYASVIKAFALKKDPPLIDESLATVNKRTAKGYSKYPREELLKRFQKANRTLSKYIVQLDEDFEIPYKKGGRIYIPDEYIKEIARHIRKHTKDLNRKRKSK